MTSLRVNIACPPDMLSLRLACMSVFAITIISWQVVSLMHATHAAILSDNKAHGNIGICACTVLQLDEWLHSKEAARGIVNVDQHASFFQALRALFILHIYIEFTVGVHHFSSTWGDRFPARTHHCSS